jgi:hypothetical protein
MMSKPKKSEEEEDGFNDSWRKEGLFLKWHQAVDLCIGVV